MWHAAAAAAAAVAAAATAAAAAVAAAAAAAPAGRLRQEIRGARPLRNLWFERRRVKGMGARRPSRGSGEVVEAVAPYVAGRGVIGSHHYTPGWPPTRGATPSRELSGVRGQTWAARGERRARMAAASGATRETTGTRCTGVYLTQLSLPPPVWIPRRCVELPRGRPGKEIPSGWTEGQPSLGPGSEDGKTSRAATTLHLLYFTL
ncbi:hypothetical protein E2C01_002627 [Portunus trituberculatus]|uniref:Secreted protein n=1 Tax=Portunus trituberculatus TaxID=210409 RepID=A0A5B7CR89_PORTR|nr:hypothetical protein [Portunus trituberculatus]